ncbi:MAG: hypothetical protein IKM75_06585 [Bacteroidales bacterium]|nr:hypothetical protein [Bacteroidales bacterium]
MKRFLFFAAIIAAALFTSCEKQGVPHTGDMTGNLYGVWNLTKKTVVDKNDSSKSIEDDYTNVHFYLALGDFPFPHAVAKKGSFTQFDLDDVDVDGVRITYNSDQHKISFISTLDSNIWLTEGLRYSMKLDGTYDVLELSDKQFIIQQENVLLKTITTYTFKRYK